MYTNIVNLFIIVIFDYIGILDLYEEKQLPLEIKQELVKDGFIPGSKKPEDWEINDSYRNPAFEWLRTYRSDKLNKGIIDKLIITDPLVKQFHMNNPILSNILNGFTRKLAIELKQVQIYCYKYCSNYDEIIKKEVKTKPWQTYEIHKLINYQQKWKNALAGKLNGDNEEMFEMCKKMPKIVSKLCKLWKESTIEADIYQKINKQVQNIVYDSLTESSISSEYRSVFKRVIYKIFNQFIQYEIHNLHKIKNESNLTATELLQFTFNHKLNFPNPEIQLEKWINRCSTTNSIWFKQIVLKYLKLAFYSYHSKRGNLSANHHIEWVKVNEQIHNSWFSIVKSKLFYYKQDHILDLISKVQKDWQNQQNTQNKQYLKIFWRKFSDELIDLMIKLIYLDDNQLTMDHIYSIADEWERTYGGAAPLPIPFHMKYRFDVSMNWYCSSVFENFIQLSDAYINPLLKIRTVKERFGAELFVMRSGMTGELTKSKCVLGFQQISQIDLPANLIAKVHDLTAIDSLTYQGKNTSKTGANALSFMELDAFLCAGTAEIIADTIYDNSDKMLVQVCINCNEAAGYRYPGTELLLRKSDIFQPWCAVCERSDTMKPAPIPFTLHLLNHYASILNIGMQFQLEGGGAAPLPTP